jgi:short repeat uncharacterized protein DUF308
VPRSSRLHLFVRPMLFGRRRIERRHNFPRMRSEIGKRRSRQQVLGGSSSYSLRVSRHDTTRIEIRTLYLGTVCFGTIVPGLVLEFGWPGTGPSRYTPPKPHGISVVFGIGVMLAPGAGALALVWVIGAYALIIGVLLVALAFRLKKHAHS